MKRDYSCTWTKKETVLAQMAEAIKTLTPSGYVNGEMFILTTTYKGERLKVVKDNTKGLNGLPFGRVEQHMSIPQIRAAYYATIQK